MGILDNPWFVGIGGGILSGFVVTLITRYLFSRRDNREYAQKVVTANQEVAYAIRPGISEGIIPAQDVLQSLIAATARKYAIDPSDLYDAKTFADVLIKEVMDSSFLPASSKTEFCKRLSEMKPSPLAEAHPRPSKSIPEIADYRRRMVTMMSGMLGVMTALMTLVFAILNIFGRTKIDIGSKDFILVVPTVLTLLVAIVATYAMWMFRLLERRRREESKQKAALTESEIEKRSNNN